MDEEKRDQSLSDQVKNMWGKIAWVLWKWWENKKEFTFWVSKEAYMIALLLFIVSIWAFVLSAYYTWQKNEELNARAWELKELSNYNLPEFSKEMSTEGVDLPTNVQWMVDLYDKSVQDKKRIEGELNFKTSIYNEFLRNFLLPSLNIWKNPYTKEIDISMMWKKYLDLNPYQDISLLSQWSSIIRDSWKEVWLNEVTDMKIWDIIEDDTWHFKIPITVSFTSNSKRAFLLLVDKLSLTSNISNIWLLNDFLYYLFNTIRELKEDEIQAILEEFNENDSTKMEKWEDMDDKYFENMIISRYLYNWILWDDEEPCRLIDEEVIDATVKKSIVCNDKDSEICYFDFRDKYRNIPELAYSIWIESVVNKPLALKRFIQDLPPLIAIESFTFDKQKSNNALSLVSNTEYVGQVNFNIYGRWITEEEINEITKKLAEDCFWSWTTNDLELKSVLAPVQAAIEQIDELWQNSVGRMSNLIELREILNEDSKNYWNLSPYNKMIRKFEYYRMLKNIWGICE